MFSRTCRFYRRIEREEIGLIGDIPDHVQYPLGLGGFAGEMVEFLRELQLFVCTAFYVAYQICENLPGLGKILFGLFDCALCRL
ncbi:hypothetical protein D3C81_1420390 [compost metagenome]